MTNFTNEQLEAWAGLGPWHRETGCDDDGEVDLESQLYVCDQDTVCDITVVCTLPECHITDSDKREERVRLIAAAPALAAALLAERKAREVEVWELRAAIKPFVDATRLVNLRRLENNDVLLKLTWPSEKGYTCWTNLAPWQIEKARQALKGQRDD